MRDVSARNESGVAADALIEIDGVAKVFVGQDGEEIVALDGTDLRIGRGEFLSIGCRGAAGTDRGRSSD